MTTIVKLLRFEEGWSAKPYVDTEGYPTAGYGFKLGPKLPGNKYQRQAECARLYDFVIPQAAGDVWLLHNVSSLVGAMLTRRNIAAAMRACAPNGDFINEPRSAVLISMAYQMGVDGLEGFRNTLLCIVNGDWFQAETQMLKSKWASQTPNRARRHAAVMRTGILPPEYL